MNRIYETPKIEVIKNGNVTEEYSEAVQGAISTYNIHIKAIEKKDINTYLDTFIKRDREFIREVSEHLMDTTNTVYHINGIEIIKETDRNIVLEIEQTIVYEDRKTAELAEFDNTTKLTFINEDGLWRIRAI